MTGQIDGSIVVWDDGNAGNTAQPEGGASREPRRPLFVWECRSRIGRAQANEIPWSNRAQKSPGHL